LVENPISIYNTSDGGQTWFLIVENYPNLGYYPWTVPSITTANALIRVNVTDEAGRQFCDVSDTTFAIDPPIEEGGGTKGIELPANGDSLGVGEQTIRWDIEEVEDLNGIAPTGVNLSYSIDGGSTWISIANGLSNTGTFSWTVPNDVNSQDCYIRLEAVDTAGAVSTFISGRFTIDTEPPRIVHKPVEDAEVGERIPIYASITDNFEVQSAIIYYRMLDAGSSMLDESEEFYPIVMIYKSGSVYYAEIPNSGSQISTIEYYIEATDGVNLVDTEIYEIKIELAEEQVTQTPETTEQEGWQTPSWIILLGATGVGVIIVLVAVVIALIQRTKRIEGKLLAVVKSGKSGRGVKPKGRWWEDETVKPRRPMRKMVGGKKKRVRKKKKRCTKVRAGAIS
jgi:hypothetical protein